MSWLNRLLPKARRDAGGMRFFSAVPGDIRYGWRTLRKSPGFTAVAIFTLALGIGANTAIFSAVNGTLLARLPYPHASQLVDVYGQKRFPGGISASFAFSKKVIEQVLEQTPGISGWAFTSGDDLTLSGSGAPAIVWVVKVSSEFFPLLGVRPLLGRPLVPGDVQAGAKPVVVLSYHTWSEHFGRDAGILGRTIFLDEKPYSVVGVMPPEFRITEPTGRRALWAPLILPAGAGGEDSAANPIARLKSGASLAEANAQLKTLSVRIQPQLHGLFAKGAIIRASRIEQLNTDFEEELWILLAAVGFVLLIACVNVSSLVLARGWGRRREIAIRMALGATRRRVAGQFLVESLLLACGGGLLGLVLAFSCVPVLRRLAPPGIPGAPGLGESRIDANVLWFVLGISLVTGILFGLAPALQITRRDLGGAVKESTGGSLPDLSARRPRRLRSALAAFEVALAVILVVGATLMARSLVKVAARPLGFRTEHVLAMSAELSRPVCGGVLEISDRCRGAIAEITRRIGAVPGVESAAFAEGLPTIYSPMVMSIQIEGQRHAIGIASGEANYLRVVSPAYFDTLGMPLESGRGFQASDVATGPRVAIVNEAFARKYFSGNAIGWRFSINRVFSGEKDKSGTPEWIQIVGEVGDSEDLSAGYSLNPSRRYEARAGFYLPVSQDESIYTSGFVARTGSNPAPVAAAVERALWSVDKDAAVTKLETMDQIISENAAGTRFQTLLLGSFGALGLLLALVGIYGVISFGVGQRTHEIGVRMALGARPVHILRLVVGEGMLLAGAGLACGIGGALGLTRFLRSLLFEVSPFDAASFAAVAIVIAGVSLAACWIPARRAMRIDPVAALRHQ
ncbi:MAG TPA: ABC transporter permease [Candidatus Acidoferrales bacterium]|nr:ABC transporter permease [Candidatus Acidoferrales bacterium]